MAGQWLDIIICVLRPFRIGSHPVAPTVGTVADRLGARCNNTSALPGRVLMMLLKDIRQKATPKMDNKNIPHEGDGAFQR